MREWLVGWLLEQDWYALETADLSEAQKASVINVLLQLGVSSFNYEGYKSAYFIAVRSKEQEEPRIKMEVLPDMAVQIFITPENALEFAEYIIQNKSKDIRELLVKWQNDEWKRIEEQRNFY